MVVTSLLLIAACQESSIDDLALKAERELPPKMIQKMKTKGMTKNAPIMIRLIKDEHVVEVWKQKSSGRYEMLQNYNICAWSGTLGPKIKEGDRQAPEGYYAIHPSQMNPASQYYLSINTGFPNAYDRAFGRTGADLMIHGACSSSGCYSMTDESVQQIFAFARDAFEGGQKEIMLEALPFRMTPEKMALYSKHKDFAFWQMLKEGYDYFELTKTPPKVDFCEKKYVFNRLAPEGTKFDVNATCPTAQPKSSSFVAAYQSYDQKYQSSFAAASRRFANTPFPVVYGGKSRPLDKKWKPQPVRAPRGQGLPVAIRTPIENESVPALEKTDVTGLAVSAPTIVSRGAPKSTQPAAAAPENPGAHIQQVTGDSVKAPETANGPNTATNPNPQTAETTQEIAKKKK